MEKEPIDLSRSNMSPVIEQHTIVRQLILKRRIYGSVSLMCSLAVMYLILCIEVQIDLSNTRGWVLLFQPWSGERWWWIVLGAIGIYVSSLSKDRYENHSSAVQIYPELKDKPDWLSNVGHIHPMIEDLCKEMNVVLDRVYVVKAVVPNAFASLVLQRGHVIILHQNLLDIMDVDSLRAILAHELAHVKGEDVRHRMLNILPRLLIGWLLLFQGIHLFALLLLSSGLESAFIRLFYLLAYGVVVAFIFSIIQWFENQYSQVKENLADVYGASYASVEGSINAFLRLNERSHTLEAFTTVLKRCFENISDFDIHQALKRLPTGSKTEQDFQRVAIRCYIESRFGALCHDLKLNDESTQTILAGLIEDGLENLVAVQEDSQTIENIPFVWKQFDWNHDGFLQRDELKAMVEALRKDTTALTDQEGSGTHPSIRSRILLLADTFLDD